MNPSHLESPKRIRVIRNSLEESDLPTNFIKAATANPKDILNTHVKDLYQTLKKSQSKGRFIFTPDTVANNHTFQAALTAAGGSIQTAINTYKNTSFAMLRPPGHHATTSMAMGFCFFNNIAIATNHLLDTRSSKVAIIDLDNHHGNGTQDIFFENSNVLYASLHAAPNISFPGTGYANEVGSGEGAGTTVNVPLPFRTNNVDYLFAFDTIIDPIIRQFKPKTILVSLGLDSLNNDPYGVLGLSTEAFTRLGFRIGKLRNMLTKNKIGVFLEGGYKLEEMGEATINFFRSLLSPEKYEKEVLSPSKRIQRLVHQVRSIQRNYWYAI